MASCADKESFRPKHETMSHRHILLVEDDEEMRQLLAIALSRRGFQVTEVRDGSKALEYLAEITLTGERDKVPELLLTDDRMPCVCGLDVIEAMQSAGMQIPAILITAFGDAETHERAHALGKTPVLDKPFEIGDLLAMVERVAAPRNP
jgi:CheY-like chemotaxis protein